MNILAIIVNNPTNQFGYLPSALPVSKLTTLLRNNERVGAVLRAGWNDYALLDLRAYKNNGNRLTKWQDVVDWAENQASFDGYLTKLVLPTHLDTGDGLQVPCPFRDFTAGQLKVASFESS